MVTNPIRLFGRESEQRQLEDLLGQVGAHGGVLLLRGDAGIGKSALLAHARAGAGDHGFQVLTATGVQSETQLAFAGLHQLLRPVLKEAEVLPAPQQSALSAAFGMSDAAVPDLFLIALATLNLLAETAARAPLLILVEDAQWLDRPTCDVLTFVARRLDSDPIVLIAAIREGFDTPFDQARLPGMSLLPLDGEAAGALLDAVAPDIAVSRRDLILAEAAGNPLALTELPIALRSERSERGDSWVRLTPRLEEAFISRITDLPGLARSLLLVAAVDDAGDPSEIVRAASAIEATVSEDDFAPAIAARLIELDDGEVRFRHPLVRSAVQQAASGQQRRTAHRALAERLEDQPDRRAWHRAASIIGPDEAAASEPEAAAIRALNRGGLSVAVAALERASQLASDPISRARLCLMAAEIAFDHGRPEPALRVMEEVRRLPLPPPEQARLMWLEAMLGAGDTGDPVRLRALLRTADEMRISGQTDLSLRLLSAAAMRCYWADPGNEARCEVAEFLERLDLPENDGWTLLTLAYAAPVEYGSVVLDRLSRISLADTTDPIALYNLGTAATVISAFDIAATFVEAAIESLRQRGHLALLAQALMVRAWVEVYLGNLNVAWSIAEEGRRLSEESGQPLWQAGAEVAQATQAALHGDIQTAEALASRVEAVAAQTGTTALLAVAQLTRGLASLAAGRYEEAYDRLHRVFDPSDPAHHFLRCWAIGDIAEAAVHCGREQEVLNLLSEMEQIGEVSPMPWLLAGLAYARGLLADDREAEARFQSALAGDLVPWPFFRGRLQLAYGTWLRRHRRVTESRQILRDARDTLDGIGAVPWAERARSELRAAGEISRDRTPQIRERLTPQELQIAHMAARGLSNREIGQQLFLSPRTVGSHLYRVFPKLGVSSRSQLTRALTR
jgi:DNA-binding CsgD family transcriptional regulator